MDRTFNIRLHTEAIFSTNPSSVGSKLEDLRICFDYFVGYNTEKEVLVALDTAGISHRAIVMTWPSVESSEVEAIHRVAVCVRGVIQKFLPFHVQNNMPSRLLSTRSLILVPVTNVIEFMKCEVVKVVREKIDVAISGKWETEHIKDLIRTRGWYSILSHRWSTGELMFSDLSKSRHCIENIKPECSRKWADKNSQPFWERFLEMQRAIGKVNYGMDIVDSLYDLLEKFDTLEESNKGFRKLVKFCHVSFHDHGMEFAWVDTCCIDKSNKVELEAAIQSMFKWYRNSHICIVHGTSSPLPYSPNDSLTPFRDDEWFRRGWTLQELLAPRRIKFYDKNWRPLTSREQMNDKIESGPGSFLIRKISEWTNISMPDLLNFEPGLHHVGKRLQWASRRATTHVEDQAYCLFGLFDMRISINYGEGKHAFYRLQEAIIQASNDRSPFNLSAVGSTMASVLEKGLAYLQDPYEEKYQDKDTASTLGFRPDIRLSPPFLSSVPKSVFPAPFLVPLRSNRDDDEDGQSWTKNHSRMGLASSGKKWSGWY